VSKAREDKLNYKTMKKKNIFWQITLEIMQKMIFMSQKVNIVTAGFPHDN